MRDEQIEEKLIMLGQETLKDMNFYFQIIFLTIYLRKFQM